MDLLLDTCAFIWLIDGPEFLSSNALNQLQNMDNNVYLSAVSLWEIQQKWLKGKIFAEHRNVSSFCIQQRKMHYIEPLDFNEESAAFVEKLPAIHQDPFDRMLICQAMNYGLSLVTPDKHIQQYDVPIVW